MAITRIKGYDINVLTIKDSFNRRAQRYKNSILESLRALGLTEDDVLVELEPMAMKRAAASASWYLEGHNLHYSYKACTKYVENLFVVSKVIELEVQAVLSGEKELRQFVLDFSEDSDVEDERAWARELLDVPEDCHDLNVISKKYKKASMSCHPDMPDGDLEKFQELNKAHKILKRELE